MPDDANQLDFPPFILGCIKLQNSMQLKMKLHILNVKHYATGNILELTTIWEAIVPTQSTPAKGLRIVVTPGPIFAIRISTVAPCHIWVLCVLIPLPAFPLFASTEYFGFASVSGVARQCLTDGTPIPGTCFSFFVGINTAVGII